MRWRGASAIATCCCSPTTTARSRSWRPHLERPC
jgi:hypothetical protein